MSRFRMTAMACVAAGLLGAAVVVAVLAAPVPAQPARAKVKWEYKALTRHQLGGMAPKGSKDPLTDTLNQLGDEGWELVTVAPPPPAAPGGFGGLMVTPDTFFFKRQR